MQTFGKLILKLSSVVVLIFGLAMSVMAADISGSWSVTLETDGGAGMMNINLVQEGEELKGTVSGDVGEAPVTGKVENNSVTFSHDLPNYGVSASYSGEIDGNTIKGSVDFASGAALGSFTAQRKE